MPIIFRGIPLFAGLLLILAFAHGFQLSAQTFGSIQGTVTDQTNAVVPGASVEIHNPVSGFSKAAVTDDSGHFSIQNVPFNPYHVTVTRKGFSPESQDVDIRSVVPTNLNVNLKVIGTTEAVDVEAA